MKNIKIKGMTEFGRGGMTTKIEAARICYFAGCNMVISNGLYLNPINQIEKKIIAVGLSLKFQNYMQKKNGL